MANGSLHTLRISGSDSALVLRQIGKMHDARMVHYVESQALDPVREKKRYRRRRVLHVCCTEPPGEFGSHWKITRTECNTCNTLSRNVLTARNQFLFATQGFESGWGTRIRT